MDPIMLIIIAAVIVGAGSAVYTSKTKRKRL